MLVMIYVGDVVIMMVMMTSGLACMVARFTCLLGPCVFCLVLNGCIICCVGGLQNEFWIAPTAYFYVSILYSSLQLYSAVVTLARRPYVQFAAIVQFAAYVQFAAIV